MCSDIKFDCSPYLLRRLRSLEEALRDREIARALLAAETAAGAERRSADGVDDAAAEAGPPGGGPAVPSWRAEPG